MQGIGNGPQPARKLDRIRHPIAELTGIILTKLDGTAKGGIVIAISAGLGVPVKLVGVGEGIDDLIDFDRAAFLEAILPPVHENAENDEEQTEEDENAET